MASNYYGEQLQEWTYERPPDYFDLVQNNLFSNFIRFCIHLIVRLSFRYYHRFTVHGAESIKNLKSAILVANHTSHLDALCFFSAFPLGEIHRLRSLAAEDYFFENPVLRMLAFFFANTIPISRVKIKPGTICYCLDRLEEGNNLIIFPEGTRSMDGEIHEFLAGAGFLALKYHAPVIPAYIVGTFQSLRKGYWLPRPKKIEIYFEKPLNFNEVDCCKENCEEVARKLETVIKEMKNKIADGERNEKDLH